MGIAERMKENYELRQRPMLTRRMPVIIRVDGRAFHSLTKQLCATRPFDEKLHQTMIWATMDTAKDMQGFKIAYQQSDEVSFLLTDYDNLTTEAWFDYNQAKLCSITASLFTGSFNYRGQTFLGLETAKQSPSPEIPPLMAFFDARAFNIPREEVSNYFLWRMQDWERNSVQMLARAHFSQNELHGKHIPEIHEMLHTVDVNWSKLEDWKKNGTWVGTDVEGWGGDDTIRPTYEDVNEVVQQYIYPQEITDGTTGKAASITDSTAAGTAECDAQGALRSS